MDKKEIVIDGVRYRPVDDEQPQADEPVLVSPQRQHESDLVEYAMEHVRKCYLQLQETREVVFAALEYLFANAELDFETPSCQTFSTLDGTARLSCKVSEPIEFGSELEKGKQILLALVQEWSHGARRELQEIVLRAFTPKASGNLPRDQIIGLLQYEIEDDRWKEAMGYIRASIRKLGKRVYPEFKLRDKDGRLQALVLALSKVDGGTLLLDQTAELMRRAGVID